MEEYPVEDLMAIHSVGRIHHRILALLYIDLREHYSANAEFLAYSLWRFGIYMKECP